MENLLNLNKYGVAEMQYAELEQTEGGVWPYWGVVALTITVLNADWDKIANDVKRGFAEGSK